MMPLRESRAFALWSRFKEFLSRLASADVDRGRVREIREEYMRKYPHLLHRF
jgi:hypothetical protein